MAHRLGGVRVPRNHPGVVQMEGRAEQAAGERPQVGDAEGARGGRRPDGGVTGARDPRTPHHQPGCIDAAGEAAFPAGQRPEIGDAEGRRTAAVPEDRLPSDRARDGGVTNDLPGGVDAHGATASTTRQRAQIDRRGPRRSGHRPRPGRQGRPGGEYHNRHGGDACRDSELPVRSAHVLPLSCLASLQRTGATLRPAPVTVISAGPECPEGRKKAGLRTAVNIL